MKPSGTCHNFWCDYAISPGSGQKRLPSKLYPPMSLGDATNHISPSAFVVGQWNEDGFCRMFDNLAAAP